MIFWHAFVTYSTIRPFDRKDIPKNFLLYANFARVSKFFTTISTSIGCWAVSRVYNCVEALTTRTGFAGPCTLFLQTIGGEMCIGVITNFFFCS